MIMLEPFQTMTGSRFAEPVRVDASGVPNAEMPRLREWIAKVVEPRLVGRGNTVTVI